MTQTNNNSQYLTVLSILHYILGGLVAAFSLLSLIYIGLGVSFIASDTLPPDPELEGMVPEFGWIFLIVGLIFLVLGLTFSICLIVSGRSLAKRKRYWFSFVIACVECLSVPLGTILGIFTIVLLSQDSVKSLYRLDSDA